MIRVFLFLVLLCIQAACSSSRYSSEYLISHYLNASEDNEIALWRKKLGIPMDALIAIYSDEHYVIVESNTRIREIQPHLSPYVNDFVDCYVNMAGIYHQQSVVLQAPCTRKPMPKFFGREEN